MARPSRTGRNHREHARTDAIAPDALVPLDDLQAAAGLPVPDGVVLTPVGETRVIQVNDMRFERAWWLLSPVFWVAIKLTHPKQFAALKEVLESVEEQAGHV